jgi:hypothetical protein
MTNSKAMGKKSRQKRQKTSLAKPQKVTTLQLSQETALGARLASPQVTTKVLPSDDYSHVRGEIRRILAFMAVVVVMLTSVVIVNSRSNLLKNLGGDIASFLQLK